MGRRRPKLSMPRKGALSKANARYKKNAEERRKKDVENKRCSDQMASCDQLVMSDVKIEIDIAEDPESSWGSQHQCSGTKTDWSENSVNSTITRYETDYRNPSAAAMNSEPHSQSSSGHGIITELVDSVTGDTFQPASQPAIVPGIKAEPVDNSVTGDVFHQFLSADNKEGKVDIKHGRHISADSSSSLLDPWSAVKSEDCEPAFGNGSDVVEFQVTKADEVTSDIISNIKTTKSEVVTADIINDDVQNEAVTTYISEAISNRAEEKNRPEGVKQVKTDSPSSTNTLSCSATITEMLHTSSSATTSSAILITDENRNDEQPPGRITMTQCNELAPLFWIDISEEEEQSERGGVDVQSSTPKASKRQAPQFGQLEKKRKRESGSHVCEVLSITKDMASNIAKRKESTSANSHFAHFIVQQLDGLDPVVRIKVMKQMTDILFEANLKQAQKNRPNSSN